MLVVSDRRALAVDGPTAGRAAVQTLTFGTFQQKVAAHQVESPVVIRAKSLEVQGTLQGGVGFTVGYTQDFNISTYLRENNIDFTVDSQTGSGWTTLALYLLFPAILVAWLVLARRRPGWAAPPTR